MRLGCWRLTLWIININYWQVLLALMLLGTKLALSGTELGEMALC